MMRLFHKCKKTNSNENWERYVNARNEYKIGLDTAESRYRKRLTESLLSNNNSKAWWSTVKWLLGKYGDTAYPSLNINGKQISDNKEKAEAFNEFFLSHSNIDDSEASLHDDHDNDDGIEFLHKLESIIATEDEVRDLLECIDTTKATGPDGISPKLLYEAGQRMVHSLTKLINLSLATGKIPKKWKFANVIPLFKKGNKHECNS